MTMDRSSRLGPALAAHGWKLAVAESCTGGLVGHLITNTPGSSDYFLGGIISYAYEAKENLLGVARTTLDHAGAVSEETALEMARGARKALGAEVALSVTGIAGPGGGTADKPVGLTWIAVSTPVTELVRSYTWAGDRAENKLASAEAAIALVLSALERAP